MASFIVCDVQHTLIRDVWFFRRFVNGVGYRLTKDKDIGSQGFYVLPHTYVGPSAVPPDPFNTLYKWRTVPRLFWYRVA